MVRWRALFWWDWIPAFAGNTDLKVRFQKRRCRFRDDKLWVGVVPELIAPARGRLSTPGVIHRHRERG